MCGVKKTNAEGREDTCSRSLFGKRVPGNTHLVWMDHRATWSSARGLYSAFLSSDKMLMLVWSKLSWQTKNNKIVFDLDFRTFAIEEKVSAITGLPVIHRMSTTFVQTWTTHQNIFSCTITIPFIVRSDLRARHLHTGEPRSDHACRQVPTT